MTDNAELADRLDALAEQLHADAKLKQDTIVLGVVSSLRDEAKALRATYGPPIEFICSICLYDGIDWEALDEEQRASRNLLTVINGQMTCEYHASIVGGGDHGVALMFAKQHGMRS